MTLYAICNPDVIKKVETAMQEELAKLLKDGVTAEELARAKSGFLQQQQVSRTSDGALTSRAGRYAVCRSHDEIQRRPGKEDRRGHARAGVGGAEETHRPVAFDGCHCG